MRKKKAAHRAVAGSGKFLSVVAYFGKHTPFLACNVSVLLGFPVYIIKNRRGFMNPGLV